MARTVLAAAALCGVLFGAATAEATTVTDYTSAWFFGDSLTDPGNLYADTHGAVPHDPPYYQGRSSNGRVWAEHVADDFAAKGLPSHNYAYAYATAVETDDAALGRPFNAPDLADQLDTFAKSGAVLGRRPVATLWFGANDLLTTMAATPTPDAVGAAAVAAAGAVGAGIGRLADLGVGDILVFNLPPLELAPQFNTAPPEVAALAKFGADTFNASLAELIAGLGGTARVTTIDIHTAFTDLVAHPAKYGVSDVTHPCFDGVTRCTDAEALERAFFDKVHPNSVVHADIAELVRKDVAPVPLPAPGLLLLVGLAGLAAAGRPEIYSITAASAGGPARRGLRMKASSGITARVTNIISLKSSM